MITDENENVAASAPAVDAPSRPSRNTRSSAPIVTIEPPTTGGAVKPPAAEGAAKPSAAESIADTSKTPPQPKVLSKLTVNHVHIVPPPSRENTVLDRMFTFADNIVVDYLIGEKPSKLSDFEAIFTLSVTSKYLFDQISRSVHWKKIYKAVADSANEAYTTSPQATGDSCRHTWGGERGILPIFNFANITEIHKSTINEGTPMWMRACGMLYVASELFEHPHSDPSANSLRRQQVLSQLPDLRGAFYGSFRLRAPPHVQEVRGSGRGCLDDQPERYRLVPRHQKRPEEGGYRPDDNTRI